MEEQTFICVSLRASSLNDSGSIIFYDDWVHVVSALGQRTLIEIVQRGRAMSVEFDMKYEFVRMRIDSREFELALTTNNGAHTISFIEKWMLGYEVKQAIGLVEQGKNGRE